MPNFQEFPGEGLPGLDWVEKGPNNIDRLHRKLDKICNARYGLSYSCLPDLVFLSDYCWEGMTAEDVKDSAMDVLDQLKSEGELPF